MFKDNSTHRRVPKPVKGLFFLALAALFLFVLGQVIMFLWNNILAEVTGVKTLNFWQAIGLFVLARILFGGFRGGGGPRKWREKRSKWRKKRSEWKGRWMNMSEEERAEMKQRWRDRCSKKDKL